MANGPLDLESASDFSLWCDEHEIHTVVVGGSDTFGLWRGKRMPVEEFLGFLGSGVALSDVFFVLTYDETAAVEPPGDADYPHYFPRKEQGYPDIFLHPDLTTTRLLPWHEGTVGVTGTFHLPNGSPVPIDPRHILQQTINRVEELGYTAKFGLEYEFYLLRDAIGNLAANDYELEPLYTRPYTYSVYRGSLENDILLTMRDAMIAAGVQIEAYNPETGPGQFELNIRYADAMRAATDGFIYKNGLKEIAGQHELMASFMAKPYVDWPGSSCHLHLSLWDDESETNVFAGQDHTLTRLGRHFVGGLLKTMEAFTALYAPTPNSYKRLTPYSWAATTATWAHDNRSTGLRTVGESAASRRIEHRLPGADVNPYIAMAACLAGGLYGIQNEIEPPEPYEGDAYGDEDLARLPASLEAALGILSKSKIAEEYLGRDFIQHFNLMKQYELDRQAEQVSNWERGQYVELA